MSSECLLVISRLFVRHAPVIVMAVTASFMSTQTVI